MVDGGDAKDYRFDAGVNLTVEEMGMPREIRFLSEGRKDLAGICARMAMVDAMKRTNHFLFLTIPCESGRRKNASCAYLFEGSRKRISGYLFHMPGKQKGIKRRKPCVL